MTDSKMEMECELPVSAGGGHFWGRKWYPVYIGVLLYNSFLVTAIYMSWHRTKACCEGVKLLTIVTVLVYLFLLIRYVGIPLGRSLKVKLEMLSICNDVSHNHQKTFRIALWVTVHTGLAFFIGMKAYKEFFRFYSVAGYFGFIALAYLFSKHRNSIRWNQILWGFTLQIAFGVFVLQTDIGKAVFACTGERIDRFLSFTRTGTEMVFGHLVTGKLHGPAGSNLTFMIDKKRSKVSFEELPMLMQESIFALTGMPIVIFFNFFIQILYYYGVMQVVVMYFGTILQSTIGTTACESISASGNIFLGMSESPLLIRPFLHLMTKSELHAVLTGGFATIAGSVMAAYISFGISAAHLLTASVMAAPSALALSKLVYPETEPSKTTAKDVQLLKGTEKNAIEAGSNGAVAAITLIANIIANLIAFIACLAFLDSLVGWFGEMVDLPQLSFKLILSKLFIPIALMLGVEWSDAQEVAGLIGVKVVINEFVAYQELSGLIDAKQITRRSEIIATYALCGFANLGSIGIQVGALSAMAPTRKSDLAQLAVSAMITGSIACFMTACVAGMLV